jgi:hypothetical protein
MFGKMWCTVLHFRKYNRNIKSRSVGLVVHVTRTVEGRRRMLIGFLWGKTTNNETIRMAQT